MANSIMRAKIIGFKTNVDKQTGVIKGQNLTTAQDYDYQNQFQQGAEVKTWYFAPKLKDGITINSDVLLDELDVNAEYDLTVQMNEFNSREDGLQVYNSIIKVVKVK
jgi:hypothetical protein